MHKTSIVTMMVVLAFLSAQGFADAMWSDDFEGYAAGSNEWQTTDGGPWSVSGHSYSSLANDGQNQYLHMICGGSANQSMTATVAPSLDLSQGSAKISMDILDHAVNDSHRMYLVVMPTGTSWYNAQDGISIYFRKTWLSMGVKNSDNASGQRGNSDTYFSGNCDLSSGKITHMEIELDETYLTVRINSSANMYGVSGGTVVGDDKVFTAEHNLRLDNLKDVQFGWYLHNNNGVSGFTMDIDNVTVPEPFSLGLLGIGSMLLLRRKK